MTKVVFFMILGIILMSLWLLYAPTKIEPIQADRPTEEEQQTIIDNQPEPDYVSESDMEDASPENAEQN